MSAMSTLNRRIIWWLLVFIIAIISLLAAFQGVDANQLFVFVKRADLFFLVFASMALIGSYAARSVRWYVLIKRKYHLDLVAVFWATVLGYLANSILPARSGDLVRVFAISRSFDRSFGFLFASSVFERIIEILFVILTGFLVVFLWREAPVWIGEYSVVAMVLLVLMFTFIFFVLFLVYRLKDCYLRFRFLNVISGKIDSLNVFIRENRSTCGFACFAGIFLATIVIWIFEVIFVILVSLSLNYCFGVEEAITLLCALSLSSIIPSTPGYIGVFQFVAVTVLVPFGVSPEVALAYIIVFQLVQYVTVLLLGLIGLRFLVEKGLSIQSLKEQFIKNH